MNFTAQVKAIFRHVERPASGDTYEVPPKTGQFDSPLVVGARDLVRPVA
jgi:hypothetical protein